MDGHKVVFPLVFNYMSLGQLCLVQFAPTQVVRKSYIKNWSGELIMGTASS
jgi:hypothetical protein